MNPGMPNGGPVNVGNLSAMNVAGFSVTPNSGDSRDNKHVVSSTSMVPSMVTSGIVTMATQPQAQLFVSGAPAALMPGHQFGQLIFPQALPQLQQGQAQLIHQQPQLIQQQIQLQHPQQHQILQSQQQVPGSQQAIAVAIAPNSHQHAQVQAVTTDPQVQQQQQQNQQQQQQQQPQQQPQQGQQQAQQQIAQQNPGDPTAVTPKKKKKKYKKKNANNTSPSMVPVGNVPDQKMPQLPYNVTCNDSDLEAFLAYQRLCTTHLDLKSKLQLLYNSRQTCQVCSREYDGFSKLRRHLQSHTDFRPYKCEHCPKSFASLSQLKRHAVTHAGLKPYKCPLCDTSVSRREHLKRHMLTHSELKPYKCSSCDHSARRLDSLHHHIRQRHAEGAQVMYLRPETCEFEVKSVVDARSPDWIPKKKKKYPKKKKNKAAAAAAAALAAATTTSSTPTTNSVEHGTPKAAPAAPADGVPADIKPEMMPTTSIEAIHQANHSLIKEWEQSYFSQIFSHLGPGGTPTTTTASTATAATPGASNPKPQDGDAPPKKKKKKKKKKKSQSAASGTDGSFPTLTSQAYTIPNFHGGSLDGQTGQFLPITSEGTVAAQMNVSTVLTTAQQQPQQSQGSLQGMGPAGDGITGLQQHGKSSSSKRSQSVDNMAASSSAGGSGDGNNTPVMTSSGMYVPPQQGTPPVSMSCMTPTPKPDGHGNGQFASDPNMASNGGSSDPMTIKQENLQHSILGHPRFSSAGQNPHGSPLPQNVNFSGVPPGHLYQPQQCYPQPPFGEQMPPGVAVSMPNNLGMQSSASAFQSVYAGGTYEAAHQQMVAGKYFGPAPNPPYDTGPFNAVGPTMGQIPAFFRKRISQGCRQLNEMASFHLRQKQPNL